MTIEIVDNADAHRYEALVDGQRAAFLEYEEDEDFTLFPHTEVFRDYRGQGLGEVLVRQAMDDLRDSGDKAYPLCPYVKSWFGKHPEYQDVLYASAP